MPPELGLLGTANVAESLGEINGETAGRSWFNKDSLLSDSDNSAAAPFKVVLF